MKNITSDGRNYGNDVVASVTDINFPTIGEVNNQRNIRNFYYFFHQDNGSLHKHDFGNFCCNNYEGY